LYVNIVLNVFSERLVAPMTLTRTIVAPTVRVNSFTSAGGY